MFEGALSLQQINTHIFVFIFSDEYYFQESFPCRLKGINLANEPNIMAYVFALVKPFLKDKLASRVESKRVHVVIVDFCFFGMIVKVDECVPM